MDHPESRWKMPFRYYREDLPAGSKHPLVTVLMLDSNKDTLGLARWNVEMQWLTQQLKSLSTSDESAAELHSQPHKRWIVCCTSSAFQQRRSWR